MTYKELQEKAQSLGLPFVGLSEKSLLKSIAKFEKENQVAGEGVVKPVEPVEPKVEEKKESKSKKSTSKTKKVEKEEVEATVAVVKNGKYEVRRYSLEDNGENFKELASEFAEKKNYQVELVA